MATLEARKSLGQRKTLQRNYFQLELHAQSDYQRSLRQHEDALKCAFIKYHQDKLSPDIPAELTAQSEVNQITEWGSREVMVGGGEQCGEASGTEVEN